MNKTNELIPRIGVGAIVFHPSPISLEVPSILLGLRINKDKHGDGEWAFPGGKLDWMETISECAIRETLEEAGLRLINPVEVGYSNDFWPEINKHFLTMYVTGIPGTHHGPRVMEPAKCKEWDYFRIDELPKPMMLGASNILRKLFPGKCFYKNEDGRKEAI